MFHKSSFSFLCHCNFQVKRRKRFAVKQQHRERERLTDHRERHDERLLQKKCIHLKNKFGSFHRVSLSKWYEKRTLETWKVQRRHFYLKSLSLKRASFSFLSLVALFSLMTASFLMNFTSLKLMVRENRISYDRLIWQLRYKKKEWKWRDQRVTLFFLPFLFFLLAVFVLFDQRERIHKFHFPRALGDSLRVSLFVSQCECLTAFTFCWRMVHKSLKCLWIRVEKSPFVLANAWTQCNCRQGFLLSTLQLNEKWGDEGMFQRQMLYFWKGLKVIHVILVCDPIVLRTPKLFSKCSVDFSRR